MQGRCPRQRGKRSLKSSCPGLVSSAPRWTIREWPTTLRKEKRNWRCPSKQPRWGQVTARSSVKQAHPNLASTAPLLRDLRQAA